jgi:hypothetical protein
MNFICCCYLLLGKLPERDLVRLPDVNGAEHGLDLGLLNRLGEVGHDPDELLAREELLCNVVLPSRDVVGRDLLGPGHGPKQFLLKVLLAVAPKVRGNNDAKVVVVDAAVVVVHVFRVLDLLLQEVDAKRLERDF